MQKKKISVTAGIDRQAEPVKENESVNELINEY